jgi:ribosomal protein S18 acetylase RimI-like enzyme
MGEINIRKATSSDIPALVGLDHSYSTEYVWQMGLERSNGHVAVSFRQVRLPRPMRVRYPRDASRLMDEWVNHDALLIAEKGGRPVGYLALSRGPAPSCAWVTDLVVGLPYRRQGIGSTLLRSASEVCRQGGLQRLFVEMQSKNHPAIALAQAQGFSFAGYSDHYYPDQDIALFFVRDLGNRVAA